MAGNFFDSRNCSGVPKHFRLQHASIGLGIDFRRVHFGDFNTLIIRIDGNVDSSGGAFRRIWQYYRCNRPVLLDNYFDSRSDSAIYWLDL